MDILELPRESAQVPGIANLRIGLRWLRAATTLPDPEDRGYKRVPGFLPGSPISALAAVARAARTLPDPEDRGYKRVRGLSPGSPISALAAVARAARTLPDPEDRGYKRVPGFPRDRQPPIRYSTHASPKGFLLRSSSFLLRSSSYGGRVGGRVAGQVVGRSMFGPWPCVASSYAGCSK
ncbi:hypothetical protein QEH52_17410 [Coraliomargarita sp. SDUM461003]|uniref:Uncharacterized protein n=1 Tax=Thalassobacterium maritimum TaxID=3041265 RepID=A0ABU1AYS5_9BACT|nr:hypothetical protein [Coraliomargarita sp. SDUM461003]MDQ8209309.1 hypothetical protein [Coraliomargarita sp. SDUM461003]